MSFVKEILSAKGSEVWRVSPEHTVLEAIQLMAEKEIGAVLVMDGEKLVGILSERDYARKVALKGRASRDAKVTEIMTRHVLCVSPDRNLDEVMALMTEKRARHLPVLEKKHVVGMISIGDVVKAKIAEQEFTISQLQHYIAG